MTKCGDCGKHEGGWYNNRNSKTYCSLCVGAQDFLRVKEYVQKRIEHLEKKEGFDFSSEIGELKMLLIEMEYIHI